jgi:DNA-binding transcriptional ArsR family regulator
MSISKHFDRVFKALGHKVRRQILDDLRDQPLTTGALVAHFPELDRCTVMQHLKVLEEADLVIARKEGRERWNHLNSLPIKHIYDRWISTYAGHSLSILDRLKDDLEGQPE